MSIMPDIALRPFKVGGRNYEPGDKFEEQLHLQQHELDERTVAMLKRQVQVAPLTRDNYAHAIAKRPPNTIGRGFTKGFLVEAGITVAPAKAETVVAPKPTTGVEPLGVIERNGRLIKVFKNGVALGYEVTTVDGELLRAKRFRRQDKAEEFLDALPPLGSTPDPASATSEGAASEAPDGDGDVQS